MKPIAHIRSDFPAKFGIPRQAGLVAELKARSSAIRRHCGGLTVFPTCG